MKDIYTSRKVGANSYSGRVGVNWNKITFKWNSRIVFNRIDRYLGSYNLFEDAEKAREIAESACNILKDLGAVDLIINRSKTEPISITGIISKYNGQVVKVDIQRMKDGV
jgi:hypothetical protein